LVVIALVLLANVSYAGNVQNFETWPTTGTWGTTMNEGWTLSNGQVKATRGGFGPPIGGRCGWLYDFDDSTNSFIQSPLYQPGVISVSVWTRQDINSGANSFAVLQTSDNGVDWVNLESFTISEFDWTQQTFSVDSFDPTLIRILKTGDDGVGAYAGIDDIEIMARPAVFLSNLNVSSGLPTLPEDFDVFVDTLIHPSGSNIAISAFYRHSTNDAFTEIAMTVDEGNTYKTTSSVPFAGFDDGAEYYVQAAFDEGGPSLVYLPPGGPNAPAIYSVISPTGETIPRQLTPSSDRTPFIISEIMYNPADASGTNSLEYIELFNTDPVPRDVSGFRISGDVDYTFPPGTIMAFRSYLVVAQDPVAVQQTYGINNVLGPFSNNLPNNAGTVRLRNDYGGIILEVTYEDELPWPIGADAAGHSLQLARPDYGEGSVRAWEASAFVGGSPGKKDPLPSSALRKVVINEYLTHTDLPAIDFIELYNSGTQTVDISNCGISDTPTTNKFLIPAATLLQAGEHVMYDQATLGFSLQSGGDEIYLWAPDFSYAIDAVRFGAQVNGIASGRYADGATMFHALDTQTPAAANASANLLIDDVVINEIMYAPLSSKDRDEYIELYNKGTNTVDLSYWRFVDGIDYLFPIGSQIPAGGYLVVARDLNNLLLKYPQLNSGNTLGDFSGRLSNRGERIALARPDNPGLPFQDFVIVDEVTYGDGDRWGKWADGGGSSLELTDPRSDNRLAMNWRGSDESDKSSWTTIECTGLLDQGFLNAEYPFAETLHVFLAQAGECLVDDIEVIRDGEAINRISNPNFDSGLSGWVADGTHLHSTHEPAEGFTSAGSLHVKACGAGAITLRVTPSNQDVNHVYAPLTSVANPGEIFTIRAKARWLAGWPYCVFGFDKHWLEASGELDVPINLGSPGLQNGSYSNNVGPAIFALTHHPVLPAANENVTVTCRAHDPDGLASLTLEHRVDASVTYTSVIMRDDGTGGDVLAGDGVYSGIIPGRNSGNITPFRVRAQDNHASPSESWFPSNDLSKDALVRFGEPTPSGMIGTYFVWMSAANVGQMTTLNPGGNQFYDITLVYENFRPIYNSGFRFRGNGRGGNYQLNRYNGTVPDSERLMGNNEIKIDAYPRGGSHGDSRLEESHAYWLAREAGMASSHVRFMITRVNGSNLLRHHLQVASRDFCKSWYGDDDPVTYKGKLYDPYQNYIKIDGVRAKAKSRFGLTKKKTTLPSDSFDTIFSIANVDSVFQADIYEARMAALIDAHGFSGYIAVNKVVGNSDSYGASSFHNTFHYASPTDPARIHLHDMDQSYRPFFDPLTSVTPPLSHIAAPLYSRPRFTRAYWRFLKNLADGPLSPEIGVPELQGWYNVLLAHGLHGNHPQFIMDVDATRQSVIYSELPTAPFTILQQDFGTTNNIAILSGRAPVDVASFRINGRGLRVSYPTITNWFAQVGLNQGPNAFVVEGLDRSGMVVGSETVTVTLNAAAPSPVGQLVISEIMYHPPAPQAEYVEIFNRSSTTFDLGGWRLNGIGFVFDGGALIGPGEHRIAAENITAYQHAYGNAEVVIGDYGGNLDNGGETLTLEMPVGSNAWVTIDEVRYDDVGAWSTNADGTGAALQLIDLSADNSRAGNWSVVSLPDSASRTPGMVNSNAMTLFEFPLLWINEVMPSNVSVIADNFGEFEPWIELYNAETNTIDLSDYRLSNNYMDLDSWAFPTGTTITAGSRLLVWADGEAGETDVNFLHASFRLNSSSGSVVLARQWLGSPVVLDYLDYNVVGENASLGSFPEGDPFSRVIFQMPTPAAANSFTSAPAPVVINEWMSDNETTIIDPSDGNYEDWFEIHNPSVFDVDLNGYTLTDNLSNTNMFTIPAGTIVPAGGFLVVWADNDPEQNLAGSALHVNFGLSRMGDTIGLYAPSGVLIDLVVFGSQGDDQSHGCWPDGAPASYTMSPPTPGSSNLVYVGYMIPIPDSSNDVYRVEANDDLLGTNWILIDVITAENDILTFTDTNAVSLPTRFYRLLEE
jgi:hypothetical protein